MLHTNQIIDACIERIEPHGAYLGVPGELPILVLVHDIAWGKVNPAEWKKPGDHVQVQVPRHAPELGVYRGSIKVLDVEANPYLKLKRNSIGEVVSALVYSVDDDTTVLEINDGVLAEVPSRDFGCRPSKGDRVEVRVFDVDPDSESVEVVPAE